jgi:GNAT superfamily N-acetyltransferase
MSVGLRDIRDCLEGVIPSVIATTDAAGEPNVSYLSQVYYVDEGRVALSNQFFSKTAANVRATGRATVLVVDARSGAQYVLDVAFERSVEAGELFERMAAQLRAVSSQHGMGALMALRSADLYRVLDLRAVPPAGPPAPPPGAPAEERLAAAARLAAALGAEPDPDRMLDRALDGLVSGFGVRNAMALAADEACRRLATLASRGYETAGVGSEVAFGEGAIGIAAEARRPVRLSDMSRGRRFAAAVRSALDPEASERTVPLPGLADPQSQLAVPMLSHGRLRGVLFVESEERFRFTREDEDALALVAAQLAAALRVAEGEAPGPVPDLAPVPDPPSGLAPAGAPFRLRYHAQDDSVFVDEAYLIKGVPGRLLLHLLEVHAATGRRDFTNRELRLDPSLRLPDLKDNLETRLILLRRRLEERGAPLRLSRPARGRVRLELLGEPRVEVVPRP